MKRKWQEKVCLSLCLSLWILLSVMGCAQSGGSGFLKKEFSKYETIAVLPFEGDDTGQVAKGFARNFHKKFPEISILGGRQFLDNPPEEKLNLNQLDDATRLKIGRRVGAQALITGMVYSPGILSWYLQVKIIDTETGEILGRSMVEIDSLFATDLEKAARLAVEKLSWW
jgi:hypothetical protein